MAAPRKGPPSLDPEVRFHYERQAREARRLVHGRSALECERQKELLARFLPPPPSRVLDVGGGPGNYALWLASRGYEVHLVDPVPFHVRQARRRATSRRLDLDAGEGDARSLPFPDRCALAVLLMGPLYHLTGAAVRRKALTEAVRVLRPGGVALAVGISRFTSLLDGAWQGFLRDPRFRRIVRRDLSSGQHRNPARVPAYFTTAYFHHPEELRQELRTAGLEDVRVIASEGPLWWAPGIEQAWRSPPAGTGADEADGPLRRSSPEGVSDRPARSAANRAPGQGMVMDALLPDRTMSGPRKSPTRFIRSRSDGHLVPPCHGSVSS